MRGPCPLIIWGNIVWHHAAIAYEASCRILPQLGAQEKLKLTASQVMLGLRVLGFRLLE